MPANDVAPACSAEPVELPVTTDDIARIASRGYPLWEPVEVMQLRNRRITVAYSNLSQRLAELIAAGETRRDANWCTYGTWTSKAVGDWIGTDVMPQPLRALRGIPAVVLKPIVALARWLPQRSNGASYRCLAAGNRFVFLEIGYAAALFLERFGDVDRSAIDETAWTAYQAEMRAHVGAMAQLDPSWLLTDAPPPDDLLLGLRQYYEALFAKDGDERAELMLAGNLLIGAYEQRRVDGYVSASLALFTKRAMRNLVRQRTGAVTGLRHWPSKVFAMVMTRGLVVDIAGEQFKVGRPMPGLPGGNGRFSIDLSTITNPLLQALLTRYDLSEGTAEGCRVRDWTSFDQRMNYITNLFRSRQQHGVLFSAPFPADVEAALLRGSLDSAETGD